MSLAGSVNLPFRAEDPASHSQYIKQVAEAVTSRQHPSTQQLSMLAAAEPAQKTKPPLCVICRRGNDSQIVVKLLQSAGISDAVDVIGGLQAWAEQVDSSFPTY